METPAIVLALINFIPLLSRATLAFVRAGHHGSSKNINPKVIGLGETAISRFIFHSTPKVVRAPARSAGAKLPLGYGTRAHF